MSTTSNLTLSREKQRSARLSTTRHRKMANAAIIGSLVMLLAALWVVWLGIKASAIERELEATRQLVPQLKQQIASSDVDGAQQTVNNMREHTAMARKAADDPMWTLATGLPWAGANLHAVAEISRSADDVVGLGLEPLVEVYGSLDWRSLIPGGEGTDLASLQSASPSVVSAAYAVRGSSQRLSQIDTGNLLPQIAEPLEAATKELQAASGALDVAADVSKIAPAMLGAERTRNYLLIIQNAAEARATGGIPGALAVLHLDSGNMSLGTQSSAAEMGMVAPVIPVDTIQQQIYSPRLGKFMQDINLTPDFPTSAATAASMWKQETGQVVDGVISVDPITLSYILEHTGPLGLEGRELDAAEAAGLPTVLSSQNVVKTLLSDVYAKIKEPALQDTYFAGVAKRVFASLSSGKSDARGLLDAVTRGTAEGRVLLWSAIASEQAVVTDYRVSGSIAGASISPAQFGVYFNDGTGAKMDYYVKRTVQLFKECSKDGYEQTTVRVTSTNTAPADAATSLPAYVTGDGIFGVPAGSVQTNIVAYGPVQAQVETAKLDGQKTEFAPYIHSNRPVGVLAIRLAPGESRTVDFTFAKIVQHTEPNVVVTPTVQDVKDVTLPTETVACS